MKEDKKGSDRYNELERKKVYLGLYRDALNTMHNAIGKLTFSETGLTICKLRSNDRKTLYFIKHRKGGNDSDLLKNQAGDINDILFKNNITTKAQHKKYIRKYFNYK